MLKINISTVREHFHLSADIQFNQSGVTAIYGQSGCGKTSLLRAIAGLDLDVTGNIQFNDHIWLSDNINLPSYKRRIGMVFQDTNLLSHLTVYQNLTLGLTRQSRLSEINEIEIQKLASLLDIESLLDTKPDKLSVGQAQRVAIARSLLIKPDILLMDEPLAALDKKRKTTVLQYLLKIKTKYAIPIVYVSHSLDEISLLADDLILMADGQVITHGAIKQVLSNLDYQTYFDDEISSVLSATVSGDKNEYALTPLTLTTKLNHQLLYHQARCRDNLNPENEIAVVWVNSSTELALNSLVRIRILAKDISLSLHPNTQSSILNKLPVVIEQTTSYNCAGLYVKLKHKDQYLIALITKQAFEHLNLSVGSNVWAQIKSCALII